MVRVRVSLNTCILHYYKLQATSNKHTLKLFWTCFSSLDSNGNGNGNGYWSVKCIRHFAEQLLIVVDYCAVLCCNTAVVVVCKSTCV